jgi:hypothetical protein
MEFDLNGAKQEFRRLVSEDFGSQKMMDFVLRMYDNADLSPDEAGWMLWNICDQYALGRANDPVKQHKYQREFLNLVQSGFPERGHWVVSDTTQGNSLLRGGFLDFWCDCYDLANQTVPRVQANRTARFQSHRANAYSFGHVGEIERMRAALNEMAVLLDEDAAWLGQQFATVTYKTQMLELCAATKETDKAHVVGKEIELMLESWIEQTDESEPIRNKDKPLLGSWQGFLDMIEDWGPVGSLLNAVINAAVAFAKHDVSSSAAEHFFRVSAAKDRPLNAYTEALFLLSCWRNGHSRETIRRMWSDSQTNSSVGYVVSVAPDLADVIG